MVADIATIVSFASLVTMKLLTILPLSNGLLLTNSSDRCYASAAFFVCQRSPCSA